MSIYLSLADAGVNVPYFITMGIFRCYFFKQNSLINSYTLKVHLRSLIIIKTNYFLVCRNLYVPKIQIFFNFLYFVFMHFYIFSKRYCSIFFSIVFWCNYPQYYTKVLYNTILKCSFPTFISDDFLISILQLFKKAIK